MLAFGRALVGNPRVLLLDEPSEGLAPQIVEEVAAALRRLKESGLSILLVEQNTKLALGLADRVVVLNTGRVVYDGPGEAIQDDDAFLSQHLGVY
jgi:branched-chain amino acid transport system ATP-binding protein